MSLGGTGAAGCCQTSVCGLLLSEIHQSYTNLQKTLLNTSLPFPCLLMRVLSTIGTAKSPGPVTRRGAICWQVCNYKRDAERDGGTGQVRTRMW
jgi:hypothetical protein